MVTNVEGVMLNGGPNCCGYSEASDKASVVSTTTGIELTLDTDTVLFGGELLTCIVLLTAELCLTAFVSPREVQQLL